MWDTESCELVTSFRGHSGAVTGARFLPPESSVRILGDNGDQGPLVVSASVDCSVRVWSVTTGQCIRSHYTYNSVTRLELAPLHDASVTVTDGGKLGHVSLCILATNCSKCVIVVL